MRVYSHRDCLAHDTGAGHPECWERLRAVTTALREQLPELDWADAPCASREQLERVHRADLIRRVLDTRSEATLRLDADTVLSPDSAQAALRAAGAGIAAVDAVLGGTVTRAFCAVRPPGHHATAGMAMGFCLFNNIAVAAAHALQQHGLQRVAIVDFDVHHGNGTQAILDAEPRVLFASSHQSPLYPGGGGEDETGVGNVFNAPLPAGSDGAAVLAIWRERLLPAVDAFAPQLLLVSAGFDAHRDDPLAALAMDTADFGALTADIVRLAERHCAGRLVSFLEGGYELQALADSCIAHVSALLGER
ncbi:MAG: histone deacetylase family protein [Pseudoxanthomonas suwonensis]|nr:histone deacetylase family protein [Pseudoxanthomonas suwonensis]